VIGIFCALKAEIRDFKNHLAINKMSVDKECEIYEGHYGKHTILLVLTGVGKRLAQEAVDIVFEKYPVSILISTGCGGALNEKSGAGDIVIYSRMHCYDGMEYAAINANPELLSVALESQKRSNLRIYCGKGVTISQVCATPEAKIKLGQQCQCDVVDMESYWIGARALERKIPFITIRSIFDSVNDDLSLLERATVNGKISPKKALYNIISHPVDIKNAIYYSQNMRKASKHLSIYLDQFLHGIEGIN
jgi:adenosylhomocysteine nucleosidase